MGFDGSNIKRAGKSNKVETKEPKNTDDIFSGLLPSIWEVITSKSAKGPILFTIFVLITVILLPLASSMFSGMSTDAEIISFEKAGDDHEAKILSEFSTLSFTDDSFRNCVEQQVSQIAAIPPENSGSVEGIKNISRLMCIGFKISNIEGISQLPGLTYINLDSNSITDIYELTSLPDLKTLSIQDNPITNITVLEEIESLKEVSLPNLPDNYCFEIDNAIKHLKNNFDRISCKGKWSLAIQEINSKKVRGLPLSSEEETLIYDYKYNESFKTN